MRTGGGVEHKINKLLRHFEETAPSMTRADGCQALKHIEDHREELGNHSVEKLMAFKERLSTEKPMHDMVAEFGIMRTMRIGLTYWPEQFRYYLVEQARQFTKRREVIKMAGFMRRVFGKGPTDFRGNNKDSFTNNHLGTYDSMMDFLWDIVGEEEKIQCRKFPSTNRSVMRQDLEIWTLFWLKAEGTSLQSGTHDFNEIQSPLFRSAFKFYLAEKRWKRKTNFRSENITNFAARAFNFFSERTKADTPAAVGIHEVRMLVIYLYKKAKSYKGDPLKPASIRAHFKVLNGMWDFLSTLDKPLPDGQPAVTMHPFRTVSFKNEKDLYESADYLPEEIIDQLWKHSNELPQNVARCFKIMMGTGLRFQDAVLLEENCLRFDEDIQMHILRYVPHKVLKHRRRKGLGDYHEIGVQDLDVANAIIEQTQTTEGMRAASGSMQIFLTKSSDRSRRITLLSAHGFTNPIRLLIVRSNIVDLDGKQWHFRAHQCRKTVAVDMIENGASLIEVRSFLGHLDQRTTYGFYAEVRKARLAEMNHQFFEKKFKIEVGAKHLEKFTEEERRLLYVDFALGHRDVEFGKCMKHASDGECGKRTGRSHCAICKQLCTGRQFEPKWLALVNSQAKEVVQFKEAYRKAGIPEEIYKDFREYQKANTLLKEYQVVLQRIQEHRAERG